MNGMRKCSLMNGRQFYTLILCRVFQENIKCCYSTKWRNVSLVFDDTFQLFWFFFNREFCNLVWKNSMACWAFFCPCYFWFVVVGLCSRKKDYDLLLEKEFFDIVLTPMNVLFFWFMLSLQRDYLCCSELLCFHK